jgi:hypothetical protein
MRYTSNAKQLERNKMHLLKYIFIHVTNDTLLCVFVVKLMTNPKRTLHNTIFSSFMHNQKPTHV